jgi:hypothetical protein
MALLDEQLKNGDITREQYIKRMQEIGRESEKL